MSSSEPNGRELGARRETSANWNTMTGSASRPNATLASTRTGRGACHGRSQYASGSGSSVSTTYRPNQKPPRRMRLTRPIYQLHAPAAGDRGRSPARSTPQPRPSSSGTPRLGRRSHLWIYGHHDRQTLEHRAAHRGVAVLTDREGHRRRDEQDGDERTLELVEPWGSRR